VFVAWLLLDLLPGEIKRTLFFFRCIWPLQKQLKTQRNEFVGARV
jgi:hypothetical protein